MSDVRDPERDQALPVPNDGPSMHDLVAADLAERKAHGLRKYGSLLQTGNGRSFLLDAYEEVLDLAVYLKGRIIEEQQAVLASAEHDEADCGRCCVCCPHLVHGEG